MVKCRFVLFITLLTATFMAGLGLSSRSVSAETVNASVTVSSACTMTSVVGTAHSATINPGTYQANIGVTTLTMSCNDAGGYSIYAVGYGNQEFGNTKLLATISGTLAPTYDISTGTNTSGNSAWAMKLTPGTNLTSSNIVNGYGSYSVVPATYTKVATMVPTTTIPNPTSLETTYQVNIASNQPAGSYNGKVRYTMVNPASEEPLQPHDPTQGCISYFPNAHGVTDTMGDQCLSSSATSATLWATNFINTGYGFAGWSDAYDYVANIGSQSNPDAHIYGPNEDIDDATIISGIKTNGLSLYAVWVPAESNMQNWTGCNAMNQGEVIALTDLRDNDAYAVAKLADGNCWMIENMRLDYNATITTANTQSNNGAFGEVFAGLAQPETANFSNSTTANSIYYSGTQSGTASIDIGTTNYPGYRFPRYRNDNVGSPVANMSDANSNVYSYGNYYSWAAAVADTGAHRTNNQSITTTSLCPMGWHLPIGGDKLNESNSEYWNYVVNGLNEGVKPEDYDSQTAPIYHKDSERSRIKKLIKSYPNNFIYSGRANGGSIESSGYNGYYWSSTTRGSRYVNEYEAFQLNVGAGEIGTGMNYDYKFYGRSIRCIAGS